MMQNWKKSMRIKTLTPLKKTKCPSCGVVGDYETDNNLITYCRHCGLVINSMYPYTAGKRYDLLCDFIYKTKYGGMI